MKNTTKYITYKNKSNCIGKKTKIKKTLLLQKFSLLGRSFLSVNKCRVLNKSFEGRKNFTIYIQTCAY